MGTMTNEERFPAPPEPAEGTPEAIVTGVLREHHHRGGSYAENLQAWVQRKVAPSVARRITQELRLSGFLHEPSDRERTECSRCFVHHQWYELQPGTGLCNNCSS